MSKIYSQIQNELNIEQEIFDSIISYEGARRQITECLLYCLDNVPELKELATNMLQYVAALAGSDLNRNDGGPGSGNFGHAGREGEVGGSAPAKRPAPGIQSKKSALSEAKRSEAAERILYRVRDREQIRARVLRDGLSGVYRGDRCTCAADPEMEGPAGQI